MITMSAPTNQVRLSLSCDHHEQITVKFTACLHVLYPVPVPSVAYCCWGGVMRLLAPVGCHVIGLLAPCIVSRGVVPCATCSDSHVCSFSLVGVQCLDTCQYLCSQGLDFGVV